MRALEKLPADRFVKASDFSDALLGDTPASASHRARPRGKPASRIWPLVAVGGLMLAAGLGLGRLLAKPAVTAEPVRQLAIDLPDSVRVAFRGNVDAPGGQGSVTISGDGRRIAWIGTIPRASDVQLYVRDMNSYTIRAVPGTAGAFAPSSPVMDRGWGTSLGESFGRPTSTAASRVFSSGTSDSQEEESTWRTAAFWFPSSRANSR
jgi:hypothetical protein